MSNDPRDARLTKVFSGSLDYVSATSVEGWAFDPTDPSASVDVRVAIDDKVIWVGKADVTRPDLVEARIGAGNHAFYAPVASEDIPAGVDQIEIHAYYAETGTELPKSPIKLNVGRVRETPTADRPANPLREAQSLDVQKTNASDAARNGRAFRGCLDEVNERFISGWAINEHNPKFSVSIDILDGDFLLMRVDANEFRLDLYNGSIGTGEHAFKIFTPISILDGKYRKIRAVITNTDIELSNSSRMVRLTSSISAQILTSLQASAAEAIRTAQILARVVDDGLTANITGRQATVSDYQLWNARFCAVDADMKAKMLSEIINMERRPKFSIVMPTYNTPRKLLEGAVQSVLDQIYPFWELCIADDASNEATRALIKDLSAEDQRIRVVFRDVNGHISRTTNSALEIATGEYICFMDHDDLLTSDALFQIAKRINFDQPDLIYSDEDKIDGRNVAVEPHFKPDFNYSLLLSYNYICHFLVARRSIVDQVGPFRSEYDGSQDHDFLLRCCQVVDHERIAHIPMILYHWRAHEASTASALGQKNYALDAGLNAIASHLEQIGAGGIVSVGPGDSYRVQWDLPSDTPKVSVIIPTRDCAKILSVCLDGLLNHTSYSNIEVIVVDNGSVEKDTFDLFEVASKDIRFKVIEHKEKFNYSVVCNLGASVATGSLLLMMNNDIEILEENWLSEMVSQILRPNVGAVGAKLLYPDGRVQHAGVILGIGGVAGHANKLLHSTQPGYMNRSNVVHELSACTAACLLIRKDIFNNVGMFNETELGVAFNDVDLCLKIRDAGLKIVYTPYATLKHHESLSRGLEDTPAKHLRARGEVAYMMKTWKEQIDRDPHYSPNLTLKTEDFAIDATRGVERI